MMKVIGDNGQLFSLDFLVAMGLAVLAIGILLNYYETAASAEREQRVQNELTAVALNASAIMLEEVGSKCPDGDFLAQGYKIYGCAIAGPGSSGFGNMQKEDLMIPDTFRCNISWNGGSSIACADNPASAENIASVERGFLTLASAPLRKADYEKCIEGPICVAYTRNTLTVKIWK